MNKKATDKNNQYKNIMLDFDMIVLLVDDDEKFTSGLSVFLEKFNIATIVEHRISSAEKQIRKMDFDAVLLDVMMPEGNGFDFLPIIRRVCDVPVIMLTALDEDEELINGLDLGADDYITKPFNAKELVARLRAINRRYSESRYNKITTHDDMELFNNQLLIKVGESEIKLTGVESNIIYKLLNAKDRCLTRDFLYGHVLKRELSPQDRSLDVHISNLRKKLGPHPTKGTRIIAIRGKGYALK